MVVVSLGEASQQANVGAVRVEEGQRAGDRPGGELHQVLARSSMYQLETMDDSSLFLQWAVDTLQHDHPPLAAAYAAGDNFPSLEELRRSALQHGTAPAGMAAHVPPPSRRASAKSAARAGHAPYAQDHIMAERKRREKINRRFIELSTVIPGLKKMDKATILSDAVKYVKEQQEKLKALEDRNLRSVAVESVVDEGFSVTAEEIVGKIEAALAAPTS
uniref:Transcription factor bHLH25 n=1 Tax=Aegilops tauschii TaxID=37682 RepID=N1R0S6_AEGTA